MLAATAAAALAAPAGVAARADGASLMVVGKATRVVDDPYLPPRSRTDPAEQGVFDDPSAPVGVRSARVPPPDAQAAASEGPSVRRALREALLDQRISQEDHDRYRAIYDEARNVGKRLPVSRRRELVSVTATLERITQAGRLSAERMRPLFLQLERNTQFWRSRPIPPGGARIAFAGSPLIFQYYRGQGLQIQPLANFGKANQLYNACRRVDTRPGVPCRKRALRELLDELVRVAAQREDFTAWEYYFSYAGGSPPWISGLAQGTAIQALARGAELLEEPSYLEVGRAALAAFERPPPVGVSVPADGGSHYLIYSFNSRLRVLNGFLQSVSGLYDFARIAGEPRAKALYEAGERAARVAVPRYDTGFWSLYARSDRGAGKESDLAYHRLLRDFLEGLCARTAVPVYCETAERFTRYLLEDPKLNLLGASRARARRPVRIRFDLSKRSRVSIRVTRRGRVIYANRQTFGYGVHAFVFTPRSAGRYRVRVEAADLRNHHKVKLSSLTVRR